jgi:hypothetical protein
VLQASQLARRWRVSRYRTTICLSAWTSDARSQTVRYDGTHVPNASLLLWVFVGCGTRHAQWDFMCEIS